MSILLTYLLVIMSISLKNSVYLLFLFMPKSEAKSKYIYSSANTLESNFQASPPPRGVAVFAELRTRAPPTIAVHIVKISLPTTQLKSLTQTAMYGELGKLSLKL